MTRPTINAAQLDQLRKLYEKRKPGADVYTFGTGMAFQLFPNRFPASFGRLQIEFPDLNPFVANIGHNANASVGLEDLDGVAIFDSPAHDRALAVLLTIARVSDLANLKAEAAKELDRLQGELDQSMNDLSEIMRDLKTAEV